MNKLRVGIAGYGVVGKRRKDCIDLHPNMEMIAICDQFFNDSQTTFNGLNSYQDYSDLLKENLDVLIVCLTNEIAPEVTIAGLKKGLHVFCEKPPGRDVADISNVIKVEKQHPDQRLKYGFNHRYHHSVQKAIKIIKLNELGAIINLRGVYGKSQLVTFNQPDWRTKREIAGGGVLLDQGIHMIDLMRLFAGEFVEVHSLVKNSHWNYNVEDNVYVLMQTKDGVVAMMNSSATQWRHRFQVDINFERGSLILGGILSGSKSYGAETLTIIKADPENDQGDPCETTIRYNSDPSWYAEIEEFYESIVNDEDIINGTSDDALQTMKLVYKIYYSDPSWRSAYDIPNPDI
jgi:predicted dehydrogenase